jgi:hypothetical protein
MGGLRNSYKFSTEKSERNKSLRRLSVGEKMILTFTLKAQGKKMWTEFFWLRIGISENCIYLHVQ